MLIFWSCSTSDDQLGWSMDLNPICSPLQPKKWNAHFLILFNFWWSAGLVDGLKPHPPPLSSQRNEMLIFWSCSTSDDRLGWLMDSNPILHLSPAKEMKCSFLYYIQLLMLARLVDGLKPHPPPLSTQKNEMLIFGLHSTSDDWPGWSMDWNSLCHLSQAKNMKCYFLDYVQLLMIGWAGQWTQTPSSTPLQPKKWNAHFFITFNMWCWPDWSMDLNLIQHSSPAKEMKCSFLHYVQLLMIGWAGRWTQTPYSTSLQPKKWNAHFCITFNIWCWPDWSMDLNLIHHPSPPKKWNAHFLIMFNFWWSAGLVNGLKPHLPALSSQ